MDKSETKRKVKYLLAFGTSRADVFSELSGQGVKDAQLALIIALQPDQSLYDRHKGKVYVLSALMAVETLVALAVIAISIRAGAFSLDPTSIAMILFSLVPLVFAWGFYKNLSAAFRGYVLISFFYLSNLLALGFKLNRVTALYGLATGLVMPQELLKVYVAAPTGALLGFALGLAEVGFV